MNLDDLERLYNKNKSIIRLSNIFILIMTISGIILICKTFSYIQENYKLLTSYFVLFYVVFFIISIFLSKWVIKTLEIDFKKLEYRIMITFYALFISSIFLHIYIYRINILSIVFILSIITIKLCSHFRMPISNELESRCTAIHEASHSIISEIYFPGSVDKVVAEKIKCEEKVYGGITYSSFKDNDVDEYNHYLKLIDIYLAGKLGEYIFIKNSSKIPMFEESRDMELIIIAFENAIKYGLYSTENIKNSKDISPEKSYDLLCNLLIERYRISENLLHKYKDSIINLAITLYNNKTVGGEEVRIIIKNRTINDL